MSMWWKETTKDSTQFIKARMYNNAYEEKGIILSTHSTVHVQCITEA